MQTHCQIAQVDEPHRGELSSKRSVPMAFSNITDSQTSILPQGVSNEPAYVVRLPTGRATHFGTPILPMPQSDGRAICVLGANEQNSTLDRVIPVANAAPPQEEVSPHRAFKLLGEVMAADVVESVQRTGATDTAASTEAEVQGEGYVVARQVPPNTQNSTAQVDSDMRGSMLNQGSVGHPELCSRPCLFFVDGRCENGVGCGFCHLPHPKRGAHLDKRNRHFISTLNFAQCLDVILPILIEKTKELGFKEWEVKSLEDLASSRDEAQGYALLGPKAQRSLKSALRSLSTRNLLALLLKGALRDSPETALVLQAFMEEVRFGNNPATVAP